MKSSRWVVALVLLALGGVGAWWLLGGALPEDTTPDPRTAASAPDAGEIQLPAVAGADALQAAPLVAATTPGATTEATAPVPAPRPLPGVPVAFRGRVLQAGVPVGGATVLYRGSSPLREFLRGGAGPATTDLDLMPRTNTGPDGRFALESRYLPAEAWDWDESFPYLVVLAEGCAPRSVRCVGCTGGDFDAGDICIEPGGRLTGRVVDEGGVPLAGAQVVLWDVKSTSPDCGLDRGTYFDEQTEDATRCTSGADGRFVAGPFWPGTVTLGFEAPERLGTTLEAQEIRVGGDVDVGDVVLRAGLALSGVVVGPDGAAVPNARLLGWKPRGVDGLRDGDGLPDHLTFRLLTMFGPAEGRTDAAGRFALRGLVGSNHSLAVEADGFEWRLLDDVLPGPQQLRVELAPAARLELTLLEDASGAPCPKATIEAWRLVGSGNAMRPLSVHAGAAAGVWIIEPLGPGGTDVSVSAEGLSGSFLHLDPVKPAEVIRRTLRLPGQSILGGRVTDVGGAALAGLAVVASFHPAEAETRPLRPLEASTFTAADGRFELRGLQPGEWRLATDDPTHLRAERSVTVAPGLRATDLDLVLAPSGAIFGTLLDEQGQPRVGARLWGQLLAAEGVEARQLEAYSDVAGRYELADLEAGTWSVGGEDTIDVQLAAGERRQLDFQEGAKTVLVVRVLDAEGRPAPNSVVFFSQAGELPNYVTRTPREVAADGTCRNEYVRPGPCTLQAVLDDGGGQTPVTVVDVPEGRTTTLDLRVGAGRARLRVTDATTGKPVPGVRVGVLALGADGEPVGYASLRLNGQRRNFCGTSDAEGVAQLAGLPPGRFLVAVRSEGFTLMTSPAPIVELHGDEMAEAELAVAATASILGKAHDAAGVPVRDAVYVSAFGPAEDDYALAVSRSGAFSMENLRPGAWRLVVAELPTERSGFSGGKVFAERTVTLQPGQTLQLELVTDG